MIKMPALHSWLSVFSMTIRSADSLNDNETIIFEVLIPDKKEVTDLSQVSDRLMNKASPILYK